MDAHYAWNCNHKKFKAKLSPTLFGRSAQHALSTYKCILNSVLTPSTHSDIHYDAVVVLIIQR